MPTPTKGPRLGGGPAHERLLLANLAAQLFTHKSITTTQTRAKRMQPLAERMITFAKRGDLAARRRVLQTITDKGVVHTLFTEIAPVVAERKGGYTRITKIGNRKGDNAAMVVIELVLEPLTAGQATVREAEAATARASRGNQSAAETAAEKAEDAKAAGDAEAAVDAAAEAEAAADAEGTADAEAAAEVAEEAASDAVDGKK
ncbi:50S ribosomal protein L17 [Kineosporia sp. J2-2]|uniref:Large ribosomal subunit protein bL17 n=1 Tax=Kineosporia corallincola TaxID=2835133 RepID=A0ABS5TCG7_9ACTN|nr:50S ribosomal protein L17 [Kineosporia corallincola]MBT0767876.1 50S ribosomal protein L17 [Kineosporia corallincola]